MKYKLILCLLFISFKTLYAQEPDKLLSFTLQNASLKEIMTHIEKETDFSFVYNENIDLSQKKSILVKEKSLTSTLSSIFRNTGISWKINGKHIVLQKESKKISVSGYISDKSSNETLIGANIGETGSNSGAATNNYGYFTFLLPEGKTELQASYVGYQTKKIPLSLTRDTIIHIQLEQSAWLKEVVIDAETNKPFNPSSGVIELSMEQIKSVPTAFGEYDVLKAIQMLPGVNAGVEGTSGIYVRGGGPDQNLTLLDGVNVYGTNHFFGVFSIFNGDAVKKVTLYKSSFPARFGGRLSSVIDTRLKEGDMKKFQGNIGIGLLSSRLNLEGPIVKDKTSFNFSARRSYVDAFLRGARLITDETVPIIYFYDLNVKLNHRFSDRSRLYLSIYKGTDMMGSKTENDNYSGSYYSNRYSHNLNYNWGNTISSLRWNYVFNNKLFANATASYNNYRFDFKSSNAQTSGNNMGKDDIPYKYKYTSYQYSGIKDWSGNLDLEYLPDDRNHFRFGGGYIHHNFKPEIHGNKQFEEQNGKIIKDIDQPYLSENIAANETALYAEDEFSLSGKWKANLGFHVSTFSVGQKNYSSIQPRASVGYEANRNLSFKTSYSEMSQYIHLLTTNALSNPTDIWVPATPNLAPMFSRQFTLGAFYDLKNGYHFSVEGFYKSMNNLLEYKDGATWASVSTPWYMQVEAGKGKSYGIELFAQKTTGKLTGWIGYTWAKNNRQFPTINEGKTFPYKYDRRHDVKINLAYKFNEKIDVSAAWTFAFGNKITIPFEEYASLPSKDLRPNFYYDNSQYIEHYKDRNNYQMPPTHHLDLSMNYYRKKSEKGRQGVWNLSIFNVYNQNCPYTVYPEYSESKQKFVLKRISFLPFLPSVTYTYHF
jgi:hypothetical protein